MSKSSFRKAILLVFRNPETHKRIHSFHFVDDISLCVYEFSPIFIPNEFSRQMAYSDCHDEWYLEITLSPETPLGKDDAVIFASGCRASQNSMFVPVMLRETLCYMFPMPSVDGGSRIIHGIDDLSNRNIESMQYKMVATLYPECNFGLPWINSVPKEKFEEIMRFYESQDDQEIYDQIVDLSVNNQYHHIFHR